MSSLSDFISSSKLSVSGISRFKNKSVKKKKKFRYAYQKMQNGLKRIFFMKEKIFGSKGKISIFYENIVKIAQVFNEYPCKNATKYFCIFFCFRQFCIFFSFSEKNTYFGYGQGVCPPPLVCGLVRNL